MILNQTRQTTIARSLVVARSPWMRARGMLGRDFTKFEAMVFYRAGSIHTCFMGLPLDVVFADRELCVRGLRCDLQPWRLAAVRGAATVIELPVGAIAASGTQVGDQLVIDE